MIILQHAVHMGQALLCHLLLDLQAKTDILIYCPPFKQMVMLEHISDAGVVQGAIRIIDKDGSLLR